MKKHLCLICTVISVVLTTLLSGCNDGNLSETSSALTFSESTSSIFINSDNTSSEKVNSNVETSSKTSSTQKEEVSSNKSSSAVSKISPNRNPSSQISSSEDISSDNPIEEPNQGVMPIGNFLGFPVYAKHTDVNQVITTTYKDNEINKQTLDKYQNIEDLNKDYPIECIISFPKYYSVYYRQELYSEEYGTATVYFKAHYDLKGDRYAEAIIIQATYTKAQFEANFMERTLKDILDKHPYELSKITDYPWDKSDKYAPSSTHRTTDGYQLLVRYEIPEEDKALWKEIRDNNGKGLTRELYYRWIVKNITVLAEF